MDEFYAQRIRAEIERIADCPDSSMLGVEDNATEEEIVHAYEAHLKNLGMNQCGYSPETRTLARSLFEQLRKAASRLGVEVQHVDHALGISSEPPSEPNQEPHSDEQDSQPRHLESVGRNDEHTIPPINGAAAHAPPFSTFAPYSVLPTPAGPVAPQMSAGSGPNSSVPMVRAGSPPFPTPLPRALTPTSMPIFSPGVPLSPGMSPMNGSYAPMMGGQTWPALGSFPPQSHPAFEALQKRAELAENQLSQLRLEHENVSSEANALKTKLDAAGTIVEDLTRRMRAAEKLALMLRHAHAETKAKLEGYESGK
jgi:hypothetical protein